MRIDRKEDVDVPVHQPGLFPDSLGEFLPTPGTAVEDTEPAHAGHPVLAVPRIDDMVNDMGCPIGGDQGEIIGAVAVDGHSSVRNDPKQVSVQHGIRETEGVQIADDRAEMTLGFIIEEQGRGIAHQEFPIHRFQEPVGVPSVTQDGYAAETSLIRAEGDSVGCSGPEPARVGAEHDVDLVAGQVQGVFGAEILMVFVDAVFVQPPGRGDPDMSVGIFCKGVHLLVGEPVGNDDAAFRGGGQRRFPVAAAG